MLYRVIIKTVTSKLFYLTDDTTSPETDTFVISDNIQFLCDVQAVDVHTFSTEEKAKEVIAALPYPYCDRCTTIECETPKSKLVNSIQYRLIRKKFKSPIQWISYDGTESDLITKNTVNFMTLDEVKEFKSTLSGWNKRLADIVECYDYGAPDFAFYYKNLRTGKFHN
jgi:hypothetical protein